MGFEEIALAETTAMSSHFEKLTFFEFSDSDSFEAPGSKSSKRNFFEIRKFQCFTVSVFQCFSVSAEFLLFDYLRNYHVRRQYDRGKKSFVGTRSGAPDIGVDPLRRPPCPLAPKNVFFPPNYFFSQYLRRDSHFSKSYRGHSSHFAKPR